MPRWPVFTIGLMLAALPARSELNAVSIGLRLPAGFSVTEFARDDWAHDSYTLTVNPKGQIVVAGRGYIRTLIDDDGDGKADRAIDVANRPKDGAMGLLWEGDSLFCVGDGGLWQFQIDKDGKAVEPPSLIRKLKTGGEHDAHALRRGPDGWLYLLCGNMTGISAKDAQRPTSPVRDPIGGTLVRFSPDLNYSEIVVDGLRNPYSFDFNADGEAFTFDSDNERCLGLPWYEGCRLYLLIPGGNYGWLAPQRAETWRLPPYFPDVVAPIAVLGRASPTGVCCYRHCQFPEKYRHGLFLGDWTFGRVFFASLTPSGATYAAKVETFLESIGDNGFAPTGLVVHPTTGDLYVSIGGRGTRGAIYRIRYDAGFRDGLGFVTPPLAKNDLGKRVERTERIKAMPGDSTFEREIKHLRALQIAAGDFGAKRARGTAFEGYMARSDEQSKPQLATELGRIFPSRAGSTAEEKRILDREASRLLAMVGSSDTRSLTDVAAMLTEKSHPSDDLHYLIVLARMTAPRTAAITRTVARALIDLDRKAVELNLPRDRFWPLRIAEVHAELARRDPNLNELLVSDPDFPKPGNVILTRCSGFDRARAARRFFERAEKNRDFTWSDELVALLVELPDETIRPLLDTLWNQGGLESAVLPLLARSPRAADREKFVDGLRTSQLPQLIACLDGLEKTATGTAKDDLVPLLRVLRSIGDSKAELPIRDRVVRRLQRLTGQTTGPDRAAWTSWLTKTYPELAASLDGADGVDVTGWQKRFASIDWNAGNLDRGKLVYNKASCAACHSGGNALGPDLRGVGGRFGRDDLLTAIIQPSKDVSPRYRTVQINTIDGKAHRGLVVWEATDSLILQTSAATSARFTGNQIASRGFTHISLMPVGLLDRCDDGEIADLLAYLRSMK